MARNALISLVAVLLVHEVVVQPAFAAVIAADDDPYALPPDLLIGAGTSAFQVEGAWNESGKAESMLDRLFHSLRGIQVPGSPDVSADSYHRYKEDVAMAKQLKLQAYRFSISWPRLLPTSDPERPNEEARLYYHALLDELISNNITPVVTMYHFDHPMSLQEEFGGWQSRRMVDLFATYAEYLFKEFGSKIKLWSTINEPNIYCAYYKLRLTQAEMIKPEDWDQFLCRHHTILAHMRAYRVYREKFYEQQGGKVGWTPLVVHGHSLNNTEEDRYATELYNAVDHGTFMHPLVYGDYPDILKTASPPGRLYNFTEEEKQLLKGSADYMGFNVYSNLYVMYGPMRVNPMPIFVQLYEDLPFNMVAVHGLEFDGNYPEAMEYAVEEIWLKYRLPLLVGENGLGSDDNEGLRDHSRAVYHSDYLRALVSTANKFKAPVLAYCAWSLLDCFEWAAGYSRLFGLVHVDFEGGSLNRTLKDSSRFFIELAETRRVPLVEPLNSAASFAAWTSAWPLLMVLVVRWASS